nr:MAG TPA: hypothetical protein [Caudoviricetes sp.]
MSGLKWSAKNRRTAPQDIKHCSIGHFTQKF